MQGANEAFLWLDRNGNGIVDNGAELFGNATRLSSGARARNGFEALEEFDDNNDGIIDSSDAVWRDLRLWIDANHDGASQPDEIMPVAGSALRGINLSYHWTGRRDEHGNTFRYESVASFVTAANVVRRAPVYDIFFVPLQ